MLYLPDGKYDDQLAHLQVIVEDELLFFCGEVGVVCCYGDDLAYDLEQAVAEHEGRHTLYHFK